MAEKKTKETLEKTSEDTTTNFVPTKEYTDEELKSLNIYHKLQLVKAELSYQSLKKSGKNKFANFDYFELKDFLPDATRLMAKYHLLDIFNLTLEQATLTIVDADNIWNNKDGSFVTFATPTADNTVKGCTAIQNLGSIHTYLRRYLYLNALNLVEDDSADALSGTDKSVVGGAKGSISVRPNAQVANVLPTSTNVPPTPVVVPNTDGVVKGVQGVKGVNVAPANTPSTIVETPTTTQTTAEDDIEEIKKLQNEIKNSVSLIPKDTQKELFAFIREVGLPLSLIGINKSQHERIMEKIYEIRDRSKDNSPKE